MWRWLTQVDVVDTEDALGPALASLRASMTDPAIALDLEWRPDFGRGSSRVALVQLASGSRAVLVRVCRMGGRLPAALRDLLRWTLGAQSSRCTQVQQPCEDML